ncbi:protein CHROMOSOME TRANSMISSION FIDELITY 7 [Selaginella moellendorffii]|uniref:protein CHROMOSOME TRANSMISSION FIDELITY 7 n=1 Tax=Selaginella moellendorffii TaxID=88036 RepID=UPI000D1C25F3|nr:protein CHROMOSOME TRANSMISSION FIDELITY 7 [Selaginella moellendorffii]|eukprot:XP_024527966.1 protein CHROMOSOME TRANSMISSION FIDELITY 7 [Selaginella moellendorffii]
MADEPEWLQAKAPAVVTYRRRKRKPAFDEEKSDGSDGESDVLRPLAPCQSSKNAALPQPKRQRGGGGQYFLDFGQSDFSQSACKVCGLVYARGQENDTKVHEIFHRNFLRGIQFKGWRNERVAARFEDRSSRVIVVLPQDPAQHRTKVKEVATTMEKEMGLPPDWLLNTQYKVYLYVESKRVLGCAVAEAIDEAFVARVERDHCDKGKAASVKKEMVFGNIKFVREVQRKIKTSSSSSSADLNKSISYDNNTPVAAACGIRGLWVMHSFRRKGIASRLLDTIRDDFAFGSQIKLDKLAFSQPTGDGIAFASSYLDTDRLLIYT